MSTAEMREEAMALALQGQSGGRRMLGEGIAWFVELNPITGVLALEIGRWTATGRVVHRRFRGEPGCVAMGFEAFGEAWALVGEAFDVVPNGMPAPQYTPEVTARLRAQAMTPLEFKHAPAMSAKAVARAESIRRANSHRTNARLTEAVFSNWPQGFHLLPVEFGQAPKLYRVRNDTGTLLLPTMHIEVRKPKMAIALGKAVASEDSSWITTFHVVLAKESRIYGENYVLTPDGTMLYRPGKAEDCWSFPDLSQEAELRFNELRPAESVKLAGCLAWYMVAESRRVVRVTWYNSRREAVNDFLQVQPGGLVQWRTHRFVLVPTGELVRVAA